MTTASTFAALEAEEQKRLLEKLAKLKALSECPTGNVNETATAAATMTRIMLEYQIEMADLETDSSLEDEEVTEHSVYAEDSYNGFASWKSQLLMALADVNHCRSFSSSRTEYDDVFWTRRTRSRLCLIGTVQDVENTRKLYFFCVDEIERLCESWGVGKKVKARNDFKRGAARGIGDKVVQERDRVMAEALTRAKASDHGSRALDLFGRKGEAVDLFAEQLGIYTKTTRRRAPQHEAFSAGYTAGASLDLGRGTRLGLPPGRG